ncbi:uncharacterized protein B0T23DRAFT_389984 [Neurospora hispaniola]|uniref:Heterokaryon incompatibility domain-containing protein n=1 Tax=Neurospora hispaniola TaxID=588809 RepID=A0AAJ0HYJ2_9PEZI|nr:hypothetical protein B0T23DRAFT_389984 [Neurospora hispaniola]
MEANNSPQQPSPLPPTYPELSYTTIPLNNPATEIRLLDLYPSADFSSPLYCRLYNTPIASPAPFKALSYAWGSDKKTHLIYVESTNTNGTEKNSFVHSLITLFTTYSTRCSFGSDDDTTVASVVNDSSDVEVHGEGAMSGGHGEERGESDVGGSGPTRSIIRITSSLDSCLRHLRAIHHRDHLAHNNSHPPPNPHHHMSPPVPPLTLWIDQLCINQSDSDEKAVQVGLMSQIYSRAKQVLIWLGPAADGSDEVMDVLAELGKEFEIVGIRLGDWEKILKLTEEYLRNSLRISAEGNVGEKRKERIGVTKEKEVPLPLGKEIDCGIGVEGGTGTACGGDGVVNAPGGGDATAGNSDEVEIGVELGLGVDVTDIEALDEAAVVCTTNKADASTGKTVVAVVEDGAARLCRLEVSGELQAFFRRPWFTRLWVVQEACHCADTVFVCGTKPPVSYDILGTIPVCTLHAVQWPGHKRNDMSDWDGVSPICTDRKIAGVRVLDDVAEAIDGLLGYTLGSYLTRWTTIQQISKGVGGNDLFTLLVGTYTRGKRGGETKLYRDRIYALLGLATDVDELEIQPDYSSQTSTAQILTDVAKAIISKTKRKFPVELLSYSQFPKTALDDGSDEQLPSWVPDWRSGLRNPFHYSLSDTTMFMACGPHRSVDMVPTTPASVLGLRGYLVDTIEEVVGTSTRNRWRGSIKFFEKLDKLWMLSKQKNKPIYKTPARREEALWRVPIADVAQDWQKDTTRDTRAKAGFALEYQKWRRTLEDEKKATSTVCFLYELDADEGYYYRNATGKMIGMRLYLTKEGYMGMGPSNTQPGDVVVVFPGARVPFVLRPTDEDNTFTYVGDAYCDGIMDGEITLREERGEFFLV